jgi:transmembrane protein TMEM260 (protein O-mannosyltransferase)
VKPSFDNKERYRRVGTALVGVGVALFVFVLYLRTLAPTVLYLDSPFLLDVAMLQVHASVLGITQPTGYPTWTMLAHLFTYLPFGDPAYRANLASAAFGAAAMFVLFFAARLLSGRIWAAAAGSLAFAVGNVFWSQAVIAEVYTLNALSVALALGSLLLWREHRRDRYLLLSAFVVGLSMTNHLTSGLLLPASLLFVALVDRRKLVDMKLVLKGAGLFLLGLTPYLYLPIRSAMDPPFKANNPLNVERFWYVVSGGNLRGRFFAFGPAELPDRLAFYWGYLLGNLHWGLLVAGVVGCVALLLWDRAVAALVGFLLLGWLCHAIENDIPDIQLYFVPTYLVLALAMAVGFGLLLAEAEDLLARFPRAPKGAVLGALSVALLLLPLPGVGAAYARNDMSEDYRGREVLEDVAENAKPNATILHHRSNLWYMVLVEKRRRDLTLVDPFWHNRDISYADIVWPADVDLATANRRYGTDDFTGVTAAKKAAENGPVYIINQDSINPTGLYDAGFRTVHVEGVLWELIPPRSEASTRGGGTSQKEP